MIVRESRLERLLGDLDPARMRKAEFSVRSEPVDLAEIAREAVRRYEAQARDFGVARVGCGSGRGAGARRCGLERAQAVSNLVENALRPHPRRRLGPDRGRARRDPGRGHGAGLTPE